jgi:hypothetical protein
MHIDVDLRTTRAELASLQSGITGWEPAEPRRGVVWLRRRDGLTRISVHGEDIRYKFEVFTLVVETREATHPFLEAAPPRPEQLTGWPLKDWVIDVLVRTETQSECTDDERASALGEEPLVQSAFKPSARSARAEDCTVAVGLLFTAADGGRLLIAADWFPYALCVLSDVAAIDEFLETCDAMPVVRWTGSA